MNARKFYGMLDEIFELNSGTIDGAKSLSELGLTDSLSMLNLISLLDKNFGIEIEPKKIMQMNTIDDLFSAVCTKELTN